MIPELSYARRIVGRDIEYIGPLMRRTKGIKVKISKFPALTRDILEAACSPAARVILVYCPPEYHRALGVHFNEVFNDLGNLVTHVGPNQKYMRLAGGPVIYFVPGTNQGYSVCGLAPDTFILVDPLAR